MRISSFALLIILACSFTFAQSDDLLTFTPPRPRAGQDLKIVYRSDAQDAVLKDAGSIDLQMLVYRAHPAEIRNQPLLIEQSMSKEGSSWVAGVTLKEPDAKFILFRLVSGDRTDDRAGKCWESLVYGDDGKPVRGAYQLRAALYAGAGYFVFNKIKDVIDSSKARMDIEQELSLYPDNWRAACDRWSYSMVREPDESQKKQFGKQLSELYAKYRTNDDACYAVYLNYLSLRDTSKAREIRSAVVARNPRGFFAQKAAWWDIVGEKRDASARSTMMQEYLRTYPDLQGDERETKLDLLARALISAKNYAAAADILGSMKNPAPSRYNSLAWPLIEKGESLEQAVGWASKAVELSRNPSPSLKPAAWTKKEWEGDSKSTLAMVLDTYGFGLTKLAKFKEATSALRESYKLADGEDADLNSHFIDALVKSGEYTEALETGLNCVKRGKNGDDIAENLKTAFAGTGDGTREFSSLPASQQQKFQALLEDAIREKKEALRKKLLAGRMAQPPVDFTLRDLQGIPVSLSALKGNVVIIDFWATWCGPCRQSFPYLQKVYDAYKDNPRVKFLAIDTWEREKDYAGTLANARKFIIDNKYTFPVLIDEKIIDQYDVDGIPTKFIIDKKGNIAFRSVGFDGPGMVDELTMQIEILLSESIGSLR